MNSFVIDVSSVSKSFGPHQVLSDLNLKIPKSSVFAFLGNNGEGKSTAIRLMLGLLEADQGSINIFGLDINKERREILKYVGCLVDSPSAYPNLNAAEFLNIACRLKQLPRSEITRCLDLVGLSGDRRVLIGKYSLGMKQRLALAHALLGDPKLLMLDEPTNGLDPSGIQEIRQLIASLPAQTGATVFVSSHQLDEVEKIATHMALLKSGKVHFESKLADFRDQQRCEFLLEVDNPILAQKILRERGFQVLDIGENSRKQLALSDVVASESWYINQLVIEAGVKLFTSNFRYLSLEQWFAKEVQRLEEIATC